MSSNNVSGNKSNVSRSSASNSRNSSHTSRNSSNTSRSNSTSRNNSAARRANAPKNNSKHARKKQKSNASHIFAIVVLLAISVFGIFAIVFLSKDLLSGDGVSQTTTIPFTANISAKDLEWPVGVSITAEEFINNPDKLEGVKCEFKENVDVTKEGKASVDITVTTADGASKDFNAALTLYVDKDAPVITGVTDRHFNIGDSITYLKGVKAVDEKEGEVTISVDNSKIVMDENAKPVEGNYEVIYTAKDKSGNTATATAIYYFEQNGVNDEMIEEAVNKVLSNIIKDDMTIEQKGYAIYNYTYDNIAYTGSSEKGDYRLEAYKGMTNLSGDCYTYFSVAKILLEAVGAKTIDVERAPGARNDHHYWLLVSFDDGQTYYHFDATRRRYYFNGYMATDAQIAEYSSTTVIGFYHIDPSLYPATPTTPFTFTEYAGATN